LALLVIAWLLIGTTADRAQQRALAGSTGLMPVYDGSGQEYGEPMARHMTSALFHELTVGARDVTLLNPGALYSPLDEPAAIDYAKAAGVDMMIMSTLKPPLRDRPKDSNPELVVETVVIDVATGAKSRPMIVREEVKRRDVEQGFEGGRNPYAVGLRGSGEKYTQTTYWSYADASRSLNKQPLGKAVLRMTAQLRPAVIQALPTGVALPPVAAGSCNLTFSVGYTTRKAISKAYSVIVNGKEESAGIIDGILTLTAPSGKLLVEVDVNDAPFRLPAQPVYVANTMNDCRSPMRTLVLELGSAGEALLAWK
jgi:hypothetical protein